MMPVFEYQPMAYKYQTMLAILRALGISVDIEVEEPGVVSVIIRIPKDINYPSLNDCVFDGEAIRQSVSDYLRSPKIAPLTDIVKVNLIVV